MVRWKVGDTIGKQVDSRDGQWEGGLLQAWRKTSKLHNGHPRHNGPTLSR